jgi:hypothetical protein
MEKEGGADGLSSSKSTRTFGTFVGQPILAAAGFQPTLYTFVKTRFCQVLRFAPERLRQ